jgi:flagellin-specific chaperone FliS
MLEPTLVAPPRGGPFSQYRSQQIMTASPMQLVLQLYDLAVTGCDSRYAERASAPIRELIGSLRFDVDQFAVDLFRLYEYCLWKIRRQRFADAGGILRRLRQAWLWVCRDTPSRVASTGFRDPAPLASSRPGTDRITGAIIGGSQ